MVIKLQLNKPKPQLQAPSLNKKFTMEQLDILFKEASENWKTFYEKNETKFWHNNIDIYDWICYPCITKGEDGFYKCILHPTVEVKTGTGDKTYPFMNIHLEELISHCVSYKPEEHKKYIIEKLKLDR